MVMTRRSFIESALAMAAAAHASLGSSSGSSGREVLQALPYSAAQLTGGPFAQQYNAIHAHYLSLSNDRLLKVYRQRAGLPAPGEDMGGWYDLDGFVPGHSLGQYISGLARIGACTGDMACTQKARTLVRGFAETLGPRNQSILRPESNQWICYTLDKHFVGLIDAATLASDSSAPELLNRVLAGAEPLLPARVHDRIGKKDPPYDEPFVMPENLFLAAELTGNQRFHELAVRYLLDRDLFDPLARGDDPFPGQHAYSHVIALSSGAGAYLTLGDAKYREAIANAFKLLTTTQQFASGGWGPNETFITPHRGELFESLATTVDHFETPCGSYAATKLARYLLQTATPRSTVHADNLERVLFNAILAVRFPDSDGDYPYYSTYSPAAQKVFYKSKWPCCSGTLVQTVADYPLNIGLVASDGFCVTLYTPSRVRFTRDQTEIQIEQQTAFPAEDHVTLVLNLSSPSTFALYLRLPEWLARPASLKVNGVAVPLTASRGSFAPLLRRWKSGDRIELTLPQDFRTEAIDDLHPKTVALLRGPVQYVAIESSAQPVNGGRRLPGSFRQIAPQTYVASDAGRDVVLVPLYAVTNESYTSYFDKG
ncbi:MAG TPA: beta-L-arabinofuranosidase domain-containing protein [Acidobacteriaceae bacterium]|nr:beta-L-arabinofuranosidase domain-containing protein [Acidobacteriaceae bacterium]